MQSQCLGTGKKKKTHKKDVLGFKTTSSYCALLKLYFEMLNYTLISSFWVVSALPLRFERYGLNGQKTLEQQEKKQEEKSSLYENPHIAHLSLRML